MESSWDENKRLTTIQDRGLDFVRAARFFDGRPVIHQPSRRGGEDRWKSTIEMDNALYTVVWLWRGEKRHIISMRRVHGQEIKNIVSFTADELKAREQRGEDRTDMENASRVALPDGADPDDAMEEVDWATAELPMPRPNAHASLRRDADVLDWFKAQGRGYQTRINAVLRSYFQQQSRRKDGPRKDPPPPASASLGLDLDLHLYKMYVGARSGLPALYYEAFAKFGARALWNWREIERRSSSKL